MRAHLRLSAEPTSARVARRFVETTLARWHVPVSAEAAVLLTSEVVTNAVLYSGSELELVVESESDSLRVAVHDRSTALPRYRSPTPDAASGRGLELVSTLATGWGIEPDTEGKWVWFELAPGEPGGPRAAPAGPAPFAHEGTTMVRLVDVPASTFVRLVRHIDALLYEVQVLAGGADRPDTDLRALVVLLERSADVRGRARAQAEDADRHQRERVEIRLRLLPEAAGNSDDLLRLLEQADELCRTGRLLSLPADVDVARLRRWVFQEIGAQLRDDQPPRPCPW